MILKKNFLYSGEGSGYSDNVYIYDTLETMLNEMGTIGVWENLTESVDKANKYTDTTSEIYADFRPKELLEPEFKLDTELNAIKVEIMNILNDIHSYIEILKETEHGDIPRGSGGYDGSYGYYTEGTDASTPSEITDGGTVPGAPIPIVTGEDTADTTPEIEIDQGITTPPEGETIIPDQSKQIATLYVEEGTIDVFDGNGKKIDTYGKGKYTIYEYRYDENGNPIAARISPDGEDEKWINLKDTNDSIYTVAEGQKGNYDLGENSFPVYDENGKQIGTVDAGKYTVYETKYDGNGNAIAVRISPDGEDERWLYLEPGKTNGYYYEIGQKGNYFLRDGSLSIYNENGEIIGTATTGNYTVYGTKMDANGNVIAIKISKPGENEQWIYLDNNTNGFYMGLGQKGTYTTNGQEVKIFDNKGNVIGVLKDGNHSVYEVKYDANGNPIAVRISPNGKEEQWIYTTDENGNIIGEFKSIEQMMQLDDGKAIVTTTTKRKSNALKYLGILGALSVALGTTLVVKKKLNKNNEEYSDDEYSDEEYTEEPLEPGDYNIYEFKKDENDNITDARISEDNAKEDLWVHF